MNKWLLTAGLLSLTGPALAADTVAPVVTAGVPSGTYTSAQKFKLTIKDSVDSAPVFYYTTDGTVPTTDSTRYKSQTMTAIDTGKSRDLWIRTLAMDASGNKRYQSFTYYIESAPVVTPSVAAGSYSSAQSFTLSVKDETDTAPVIYYTTDGTMPTKSSTKYVAGTKLSTGTASKLRLRTLAVDSEGNYQRQLFDYKITTVSDTTAPVVTVSPTPGTYESAQSVTFAISDDKDSAPKLYYTTDGSAPSTSSTLYTSGTTLTLSKSTVLRTLAVDATGNTRTQEFSYVISTDTVAPVVTVSPAAGSYDATQNVTFTVTDNKDSAPKLYYTTDGSTPTTSSTLYTSGSVISVADTGSDVDMVINTLAVDASGNEARNSYSYSIASKQVVVDRLGAIYSSAKTVFSLWSPDSSNVVLNLDGKDYTMTKVADFGGYTDVYQVTVTGDQLLKPYLFKVGGVEVRDPYGKMVKPGTNYNIVMDTSRTDLASGWADRPAQSEREDAIIYEVHVRDFTISSTSGVDSDKRGKFAGMVQSGTTYNSVKTGIDHLKELGITHVQLMPVFDFGSCPDVTDTSCYNWGYDPVNFNVPEERYSLTPYDYENRMREFKNMVNEFHKAGIRVVMDVVYNHTYNKTVFSPITSKYYTSTDLSGCGNSIDATNSMVSRMIRDSLEYWVKEYNIDGFRFDLVGIFDYANVDEWAKYLNTTYPDRNLMLYGEPWNGYATDSRESYRVRLNTVGQLKDAHFGVFNPKYRDAIRGQGDTAYCDSGDCFMFNQSPDTWKIQVGSRGGIRYSNGTAVLSTIWDPMFASDPEQSINYVSAHDNYNLRDKIRMWASAYNVTDSGYLTRIQEFANGVVLTSQGIPFIYGGDEFMRTKQLDKNSYKSSDSINAFDWSLKSTNSAVINYYKDVIAMRKAHPGFRMNTWDEVTNNVTTTLPSSGVVINTISAGNNGDSWSKIIVIMNSANNYTYTLPSGTWYVAMQKSVPVTSTVTASGSVVAEGTAVTVLYQK